MSRTIRRTRDKRRNKSGRSHFEKDYTEFYVEHWNGPTAMHGTWACFPRVKAKGHAFNKGYWFFHGDNHNAHGFSNYTYSRKAAEDTCRAKNRQEIIKYYKDEEYEILIHNPACLSWDRC